MNLLECPEWRCECGDIHRCRGKVQPPSEKGCLHCHCQKESEIRSVCCKCGDNQIHPQPDAVSEKIDEITMAQWSEKHPLHTVQWARGVLCNKLYELVHLAEERARK